MRSMIVTFVFLASFIFKVDVSGDELILKDGKAFEWRVLKDNGDSIELLTIDNKTVTVAKKDIKEIKTSIPKAPLTGATFAGDLTKGGLPVNVLAGVDPKKHAAGGECRTISGALVCSGTGVIEFPHIPTGFYDVEIVIERRDGEDECHVGLVAQGKPFSVQIDWGKGQCTGLSEIDGKPVFGNDSRVNGRQLVSRKPKTFVCAVREDLIVVLADGKEIIRWKGEPSRLSLGSRPAKSQNLFFSWNASTFAVLKCVATPRKE